MSERTLRRLEDTFGLTISEASTVGDTIYFVARPPIAGAHRHGWYDTVTRERWLSDNDCHLDDERSPADAGTPAGDQSSELRVRHEPQRDTV